MEENFNINSLQTGYEDSSHNTTYCVSPQYGDLHYLWSSPSCFNLLSDNTSVELGTIDNNFISLWPQRRFHSFQIQGCSDNWLSQDDFTESSYNETQTPFTDSLLQPKQFKKTTIPWLKGGNAFVEWKNHKPPMPSLQPRKSQSLHKRCILFLNCLNSHKISPLHTNNGGQPGINISPKIYDKLAIHHVVAERKRREDMKEMFSALRALLPMYPKVVQKSKASVLLQTIDYVKHLKQRVKQLEKRNTELEALQHENSLHSHDSH